MPQYERTPPLDPLGQFALWLLDQIPGYETAEQYLSGEPDPSAMVNPFGSLVNPLIGTIRPGFKALKGPVQKNLLQKGVSALESAGAGEGIFYTAERTVGDIKKGPSLGIYLTNDVSVAKNYAGQQGQVHTVTINIKNPLKITSVNKEFPEIFSTEEINQILANAGVKYKFTDTAEQEFFRFADDGGTAFIKAVKNAGYDAIKFPDLQGNKIFATTLVFDKQNIKALAPSAPPVPIPGIKGAGAGKGIGDLLSKPKTLPIERLLEIQQQAKQFPKGDAWVSQAKENLVKGKHTEVIIGFDDGGKPYIRDGNSRIVAAKELKLNELPVEIKLEDYPAFAPSAPQKDLLQKGIVKIRESEFDPAYIRFSFSPGKIRIAENRTGDISETSLFHGTSPAAAMRILQEGRITAKESSLNPMGGGSGRVVSLSPNKHISATFGDVVFEIDKATTKTFNPPEILLKQLGAGTELRTAESVPLENIKQVHIIADSVKGVREDILDVVRADRWNTKTEKLGTLETLANQLSERGFKVIVHTKPKALVPSAPPAKAIDTTIIKQKLQDSSDNVMDEMLDTMLGVEGLHKFYGQETPNEPPEGMPGEIPVQ